MFVKWEFAKKQTEVEKKLFILEAVSNLSLAELQHRDNNHSLILVKKKTHELMIFFNAFSVSGPFCKSASSCVVFVHLLL